MIESKKGFLFLTLIIAFSGTGCLPSYKSTTKQYQNIFNAGDTLPDYSNLKFWAAHPFKKDPSDSVPRTLLKTTGETFADVFFIHPTTLTDPKQEGSIWNASLSDAALNAKTDYSSILYQASVFNESCRVFAPRYRQAHLYAFFSSDSSLATRALEMAYKDVAAAFEYYLANHNEGRPIIIAAHSQGTLHAARLLKNYFDNKRLNEKLIAAYIPGLSVPENFFLKLAPCSSPDQTGCINSWRTFRTGYIPEYIRNEKVKSIVVNPLSWTTSKGTIPRHRNKGSILFRFNKKYEHTNSAAIFNNVLWTNRPKFFFGFLLRTKNYHAGDYNLFYVSIRENVKQRIAAYLKTSDTK